MFKDVLLEFQEAYEALSDIIDNTTAVDIRDLIDEFPEEDRNKYCLMLYLVSEPLSECILENDNRILTDELRKKILNELFDMFD